jgi:hypothetical protein
MGHDWEQMNDESLRRANAFLLAVSERVAVGEVLAETPAEIGRELGFPDALSTARAVRALIARRRLEQASGSYRLLETRPLESDEREAIGRRPRGGGRRRPETPSHAAGTPAYSDLGRAVADRFVELGKENAQLRSDLRQAREELRDARASRDDAERRARSLGDRTRELELRAEMAESNLRALLASARGREVKPDAPVGDAEMAAILGVLKGGEAEIAETTAGEVTPAG